jgi:hypothetical protein
MAAIKVVQPIGCLGFHDVTDSRKAETAAAVDIPGLRWLSKNRDRTGRADFPHPALGQDVTPSPTARCTPKGIVVELYPVV